MLLPSALPCDVRHPSSRSHLIPSRLLSTPPPSDDDFFRSGNGLLGTCRALQSLLNASPAPSPRQEKPARLQSPFTLTAPPSTTSSTCSRKQRSQPSSSFSKTKQPPRPRGANKRTRDSYEAERTSDIDSPAEPHTPRARISTPKRRRSVPSDLPLGLSQSDFYALYSPPISQSPPSPAQRRRQEFTDGAEPLTLLPSPSQSQSSRIGPDPDAALPSVEECDAEPELERELWTALDDRRLVETVLETFRLSRREWGECARRLGRDQESVGRRWQTLLGNGDVGLATRAPDGY
ncbi:uncharacterized protein ACLA_012570 [Aspergillus clavatus NRRL 1]|uniref:Myb-like domain-containing protein n=1 Tax=Aspergillus clavatus (strain ATCC 1007 / CBS 513.65 / DSM 816 / NCTC 3887 / NRRL 1 / QM 1276 / 107) TaxID=344612 RepID=A1CAR1_ASPCL|nr:uncharacterized protein ACLA_012570 [Aspergillus clavatus NRRL 1]EAW12829.1 conserved hypothetical protein [Aspergillus clavatus NRRL 1]